MIGEIFKEIRKTTVSGTTDLVGIASPNPEEGKQRPRQVWGLCRCKSSIHIVSLTESDMKMGGCTPRIREWRLVGWNSKKNLQMLDLFWFAMLVIVDVAFGVGEMQGSRYQIDHFEWVMEVARLVMSFLGRKRAWWSSVVRECLGVCPLLLRKHLYNNTWNMISCLWGYSFLSDQWSHFDHPM